MLKTESDIVAFVAQSDYMMQALRAARSLGLPHWFIGAGFLRDTVWNVQHGFVVDYAFKDLDLAYFDPQQLSEEFDEELSVKLRSSFDATWEIVNQAYAHTFNDVEPYTSAIDGLASWVETATCVGVTLTELDEVVVLAPWGVEDLLNLKLRIAPCHKADEYYEKLFRERTNKKRWLERWPMLEVVS